MSKRTYAGIPEEYSDYENAKVVILLFLTIKHQLGEKEQTKDQKHF